MYKTLPIVALLLTTTACSIEQKPAPYVEKGGERFSRIGGSSSTTNYGSNEYIDATANRSEIGSAEIQTRSLMPAEHSSTPINSNDGVIDFAQGQQNSGTYKAGQAKPIVSDYIDSEVSSVQLAPVNSANNYAPTKTFASAATTNRPHPVLDEPTSNLAPTSSASTKTGQGYLNLGAVNNFGSPAAGTASEPKKTSKLLSAKPLAKPAYKPVTEVTQAPTTATEEEPVATETPVTTTEPVASSIAIPAPVETSADTITVPAAPVETAAPAVATTPLAAPVVNKHTTKISDTESVTTTKTIERVVPKAAEPAAEPAKDQESAIEKAPIVEEAKPAASSKQFIRPVSGEIVGKFGNEPDGTFNDGIKIKAAKGTDVKAADGGEVVYSGNQLQGYGNMIIIRHPNGYLTSYAHLENLDIKKGSKVGQGDVIGHIGDTGNVTEPMLHFGVREGREPVDPQKFLK